MPALTAAVRVKWDAAHRAQLLAVNAQVNRVEYVTDQAQYNQAEYWQVSARGDCEDKALAKEELLRLHGWPQGSLDIAICRVNGAGHAVLIVHTDKSDLVLDNNHDELRAWDDPEYDWIEVSTGGLFLPGNWVKVSKNATV